MAEPQKIKRKPKVKPAGYDTWTGDRKAFHKAVAYTTRLRILLRSAQSNMEDAYVLALQDREFTNPDDSKLLAQLVAECYALAKSAPGTLEMIRDIATIRDRELSAA